LGIVWLILARSFGGFETLSDDLMIFQGINVSRWASRYMLFRMSVCAVGRVWLMLG
jgi:hypothetical protein